MTNAERHDIIKSRGEGKYKGASPPHQIIPKERIDKNERFLICIFNHHTFCKYKVESGLWPILINRSFFYINTYTFTAINFFKWRLANKKAVDKDLADNPDGVYPV